MALMKNVVSGKFRGNAGAFKFAQSAGRDVVSERVYTNKSKGFGASYKQRVQRCKIMNLANVYGAYKSLFAKAFEVKKATQSPYNAFTSANLGTSNIHLTKQQAEMGAFSSVGLWISKGSLSPIRTVYIGEEEITFELRQGPSFVWEGATIQGISNALIAENSFLQNGDQITIVVASRKGLYAPGESRSSEYAESVKIYEFTIDVNDTRVIADVPAVNSFFHNDDIEYAGGSTVVTTNGGAAIIYSRSANGRLRVSSQVMSGSEDTSEGYTKYSSAENLAAAVASYGSQELALLDPGSEAQPTV